MTDLISVAAGGRVVACNDEFFAEADNLLKTGEPVANDEYTDRGKWMDGWETRRRREPGHDWCVMALGIPGRIRQVTVDTSHFTGNYPEAFSLDACGVGTDEEVGSAAWVEVIPRTDLAGEVTATFGVDNPYRAKYVRLNIYPDGGVARLRLSGDPVPSKDEVCPEDGPIDLVSAVVGGEAVDASDMHYSHPSNLLRPSLPAGMWDGWETKRRRGPGHDWASFRLGLPGQVETVEIDTTHFKGNSPGWVSVQVSEDGESWEEAVSMVPVSPDLVNLVILERPVHAAILRLDIHPDGGIARLRVRGRPDPEATVHRCIAYLDALFDAEAGRFLQSACSATKWVESMMKARPFGNPAGVSSATEASFDGFSDEDWLEAFAGHPRIGEEGDAIANREQAGATGAPSSLRDALAEANRRYEERHGFIYIVDASGKGAEEMLRIVQGRIANTREQEIEIAAGQQRAITRTRLRRMLCMEGAS